VTNSGLRCWEPAGQLCTVCPMQQERSPKTLAQTLMRWVTLSSPPLRETGTFASKYR
jgi:hypothetical protein